MKETREVIILLYYTENAILKQTLNTACHTAQRLTSSVRELTGTLQSHLLVRQALFIVLPCFFHSVNILSDSMLADTPTHTHTYRKNLL